MASLTAHCSRCGKGIPGFNRLKPSACPWCWSAIAFNSKKRRSDGLFRCSTCHMLCQASFKFCEVCGTSTMHGLKELLFKNKEDVTHRTLWTQTESQSKDVGVDTRDFKITLDLSGIFDDDDDDFFGEVPDSIDSSTEEEVSSKKLKLTEAEKDDNSSGTSQDSGISPTPTE